MKKNIELKQKKNENKEIQKKDKKQNKKKRSIAKIILKIILLLILIAIIAYACWFAYRYYKHASSGDNIEYDPLSATALGIDPEKLKSIGRINVLILGESGIGDGYKLTDSIMLASYNPQTQQASILSIPRDTYVGKKDKNSATANYLASYKMNAVYRNGTNIEETVQRVSDITGVDIDYYVLIDTDAVIDIVDAIGGVTFNVPIDMDYDDFNQDLHIHLKAGEQLIDGDKAEQLLRFRHNSDGTSYPVEYGDNDLGRMRTQREFIEETLKQLIKFENVTKVLNIMDIVFNNIKTDLTMAEAKYYIPYIFKFNMANIETDTLPGTSEKCNDIWIYVPNKKETKNVVDNLFSDIIIEDDTSTNTITNSVVDTNNDTSTSEKIKIEILNGSSDKTNLEDLKSKLTKAGYTVSKTGSTSATTKTVIINRTRQSKITEEDIKEIIGVGTVNSSSSNSNVDFTIIIGSDYNK